ncbi:MAG: hypothetical protein NT016_03715 [Candidatus Aenigmarchaeota archaeon]|nr:hypothetical protein [Candidatus Aenigmarchaeota archaeon]
MSDNPPESLMEELYAVAEPFLSQEYRALAKSFAGMMMNASWPDTVDFLAGIAKEYGRDGSGQGYRQTRAVLDGILGKVASYERDKQPPLPRD